MLGSRTEKCATLHPCLFDFPFPYYILFLFCKQDNVSVIWGACVWQMNTVNTPLLVSVLWSWVPKWQPLSVIYVLSVSWLLCATLFLYPIVHNNQSIFDSRLLHVQSSSQTLGVDKSEAVNIMQDLLLSIYWVILSISMLSHSKCSVQGCGEDSPPSPEDTPIPRFVK